MTSDRFKLDTKIFKMLKNVSLVADGKTMFTLALEEVFKIENGTLKIFVDSNLHERDDLVGMSESEVDRLACEGKLPKVGRAVELIDKFESLEA